MERHEDNMREAERLHAELCSEIRDQNAAKEAEYDVKLAAYKEYERLFEEWLVECKATTQRREEAESRTQDTYGALVTRVQTLLPPGLALRRIDPTCHHPALARRFDRHAERRLHLAVCKSVGGSRRRLVCRCGVYGVGAGS